MGPQVGQYRWRDPATVYSLPHRSQREMEPMRRVLPARARALLSRSEERDRSALQVGQYHARGPPSKVAPHWRHTRGKMAFVERML